MPALAQEIEKIPLRHEGDEGIFGVRARLRSAIRTERAAEHAVHLLQPLMRQFQESVDQPEFVHHLQASRDARCRRENRGRNRRAFPAPRHRCRRGRADSPASCRRARRRRCSSGLSSCAPKAVAKSSASMSGSIDRGIPSSDCSAIRKLQLTPEALDLRHAAVAIGQFHRDRFGLRRELQIRLRVVRNRRWDPWDRRAASSAPCPAPRCRCRRALRGSRSDTTSDACNRPTAR